MFDLIVIGSGPAGYTGAIRAAQLGFKVACIEKSATLGGTCLNVGCIPSKALLHISHEISNAKKLEKFGLKVSGEINLEEIQKQKEKTVNELTKGIEFLFKKNKIEFFTGKEAEIISEHQVRVGDKILECKNILIATGSKHLDIDNILVDEEFILSSTGALAMRKIPETMVVIGAGYIGLELGSVWNRFCTKVKVIEYADKILPALDDDISAAMQKILEKQGIEFILKSKVESCRVENNLVKIKHTNGEITCQSVLVAVGRKPNPLGFVKTNNKNQIIVDKDFRTNYPNIYAVGDVIAGPMLAHKAEEEAIAVVEMIAGMKIHVNYLCIPSVVYTSPEIACVGLTEKECTNYKVGKFSFSANSRAKAVSETDGFVKIIADASTDKILGVHIIGKDAGHLISEAVIGMEFHAAAEDIARTCHAHPTLSEAVKEAALAVDKRSINS